MFEPTTLPRAIDGAPRSAASTLTRSSGAEVPKATTVRPTMRAGMPSRRLRRNRARARACRRRPEQQREAGEGEHDVHCSDAGGGSAVGTVFPLAWRGASRRRRRSGRSGSGVAASTAGLGALGRQPEPLAADAEDHDHAGGRGGPPGSSARQPVAGPVRAVLELAQASPRRRMQPATRGMPSGGRAAGAAPARGTSRPRRKRSFIFGTRWPMPSTRPVATAASPTQISPVKRSSSPREPRAAALAAPAR
jgi:hypothetical protein